MQGKKKLSIVVLSYNHQEYIEQALEGIFMQKVDFPIELILCDDKSPDNTHEVIEAYLKNGFYAELLLRPTAGYGRVFGVL